MHRDKEKEESMTTPVGVIPGSRYNIVTDNPHYQPRVCVFDADDGISCAVMRGVDWEPEVCKTLAEYYVSGTDVVDVGANLGLNSIGMHRRCNVTGAIHLFEPQHDVFAALRYNTQHIPNSYLYNFAVADTVRVLSFEQVHGNIGGTPLQGEGGAIASPFAAPVTNLATNVVAVPLDAIGFMNKVSVIKIDTEGAELNVLKGARNTINQHRPAIIIEVWQQNRPDVFALLEQMGYVMREHIQDTFGDDFVWIPIESMPQQTQQQTQPQ